MELTISKDFQVTSLQIADWSGKPHSDLLKAIRKMEKSTKGFFSLSKFLSKYKDTTGRTLPMYVFPKKETLFIVSKFDDKLRWQILTKLEEVENAAKIEIPQDILDRLNEAEQFLPKVKAGEISDRNGFARLKKRRGTYVADPTDPLVLAQR